MKLSGVWIAAFAHTTAYVYGQGPAITAPPIPILANVEEAALKHPKPDYPRAARARHITGAGIFEVSVDSPSGQVIGVTVFKSTGSKMLDACAVEALKRDGLLNRTPPPLFVCQS